MSTFKITEKVNFTYTYREEAGKQIVEGEFYTGDGVDRLGVVIKVDRSTREQAVDDMHKYAKVVGLVLDNEL
jgi:hypothetical protein